MRAEAAARAQNNEVPQERERIILPNHSRAPESHSQCIFPLCSNTPPLRVVPFSIRVRLFSDHKYYISPNCKICTFHLESQPWSLLYESVNASHSFTAAHIEDFCELLKNDKPT